MKHTPGPWKIVREFNVVSCEGNRGIASCGGYSNNFRDKEVREENLANSNLINAAPEMYEALELVRKAIHEHGLLDIKKRPSLCIADAAIGKALLKAKGGDDNKD